MINKNYYLLRKAKQKGYLYIKDAAKIKNVNPQIIENNITKFNHCGSLLRIKFDEKFKNWQLNGKT